jgi:hypothetical protein
MDLHWLASTIPNTIVKSLQFHLFGQKICSMDVGAVFMVVIIWQQGSCYVP